MSTFAAFAPTLFAPTTPATLAEAQRGQMLRIGRVLTPGTLGERLMELGLTPGTEVHIVGRGVWGGPVRVQVRGAILPLHLAQAKEIEVLGAA